MLTFEKITEKNYPIDLCKVTLTEDGFGYDIMDNIRKQYGLTGFYDAFYKAPNGEKLEIVLSRRNVTDTYLDFLNSLRSNLGVELEIFERHQGHVVDLLTSSCGMVYYDDLIELYQFIAKCETGVKLLVDERFSGENIDRIKSRKDLKKLFKIASQKQINDWEALYRNLFSIQGFAESQMQIKLSKFFELQKELSELFMDKIVS